MSTATPTAKRTVKVPRMQYREFAIEVEQRVEGGEGGDGEVRRYPLSFSSELPVRRWGWDGEYDEVLSHEPADVDLSRAKDGLPFFKSHQRLLHFGSVNDVALDEKRKRLRGVASFSSIALGQEQETLLREGHTKGVSVGYQITSMEMVSKDKKTGIPTYRCGWMPYEVSTEPIPADPKVGFGRSQIEGRGRTEDADLVEFTIEEPVTEGERTMGDENKGTMPAPATPQAAAPSAPVQGRDRGAEIAEIYRMCREYGTLDQADEWAKQGLTPDQVGRQILGLKRSKPQAQPGSEQLEVMSARDISRYSIQRALHLVSEGRQLDGLEAEVHQELARNQKAQGGGFFVPLRTRRESWENIQQRTMGTTQPTGGATLVGQQVMPDMIDLLRNASMVLASGARLYTGLVGNILWNKKTAAPSVNWMAENPSSDAAQSQPTYGYVSSSPKTLIGNVLIPRQLLAQASIDVEADIRNDLSLGHGLAIDLAALHGSGTDKQPVGLYSAAGVLSHAVGGVPDITDVTTMPGLMAAQNAHIGSLAWMTTPAMAAVLMRTPVVSGYPLFIWNGNLVEGSIFGAKARATNQVSSVLGAGANEHGLIYGNWSDLAVCMWGSAIEVQVDTLTQAAKGQVVITSFGMADTAILRPVSFVKGTGATIA